MPVRINLELLRRIDDAVYQIAGNRAFPSLVYACPGLSAEKTVRRIVSTETGNKHNVATAIICNSMLHRLLGSIFIYIDRPVRPTRIFFSEEAAIPWLTEHRSAWELIT